MKDHRKNLLAIAERIRKSNPNSASNGAFNTYILEIYKAQTGAKIFKTFAQWKKEGFTIVKGSQGYPVFSRPIAKVKQEKGQEPAEQDFKRYGTAILFNELQVKK
jgi:hypothetical protein